MALMSDAVVSVLADCSTIIAARRDGAAGRRRARPNCRTIRGQLCRGRDSSGPWPVVGSSSPCRAVLLPFPVLRTLADADNASFALIASTTTLFGPSWNTPVISCLLDGEDYLAGSARVGAGEPLAQVARGLLRSGAVERHQRRRRAGDTDDARAPPILRHGHDFDQV